MQAAFAHVAQTNHLHLFNEDGVADVKKAVDFLKLKKTDVAKVMGVPPASVRYDAKMPSGMAQRFMEIATICELVAEYFGGNIGKTVQWFTLPNPMLGEVSPRDMIRYGRYKKLLAFVLDARDAEQSVKRRGR